jgi:hypothetical protein
MEKLSQVLSVETFLNAFRICKELCATDSSRDVNIRLVAKHMTGLSEANIRNFYKKYIATDLVFAVPELFASDVVFIPKRLTGLREYRYFSCFSMILYNAVGLVFMECCDQFVTNLNFIKKGIYCYRPTRFVRNSNGKEWGAKNGYRVEYKKFSERCKKEVESGDVVLQIDIGSYYETIKHPVLTELIRNFAPESALKRIGFTEASFETLNFYFNSMMDSNQGIPQGRKNLVSDYLGHLYLMPFDMAVSELSHAEGLNFKCSVRYVDDIFIVFTKDSKLADKEVYRKLLHIEQRISSWLHKNLGLALQSEKTQRRIVTDDTELDEFWEGFLKAVSSPSVNVPGEERNQESEMKSRLVGFCKSLEKLRFRSGGTFDFKVSDEDREVLKDVFERNFGAFLLKPSNQELVRQSLRSVDFDLTADHISILSALLLLKSKEKSPYIEAFEGFLRDRLDLSDKRHIHILFEMLAAGLPITKVRRFINRSKDALIADNYGKYLAVFCGSGNDLDDGSLYARLSREHTNISVPLRTFLFKSSDPFTLLIADLVKSPELLGNEAIVQPLKLFMSEFRGYRWDTAFNHFHNFFHELCKNTLRLTDTDSVNTIIARISGLSLEDELAVLQFYDRRNFNAVSHPSKDGRPAVKVNRADLDSFMGRILKIIKKHLLN